MGQMTAKAIGQVGRQQAGDHDQDRAAARDADLVARRRQADDRAHRRPRPGDRRPTRRPRSRVVEQSSRSGHPELRRGPALTRSAFFFVRSPGLATVPQTASPQAGHRIDAGPGRSRPAARARTAGPGSADAAPAAPARPPPRHPRESDRDRASAARPDTAACGPAARSIAQQRVSSSRGGSVGLPHPDGIQIRRIVLEPGTDRARFR